MIDHSKDCKDARNFWALAVEMYQNTFPGYCRTCNGWGGFVYTYDPSPPGVSLGSGSMDDFQTCHDCIDNAVCPRCGAKDDWVEIEPGDVRVHCGSCNWTFESAGLPVEPECYCDHEWATMEFGEQAEVGNA